MLKAKIGCCPGAPSLRPVDLCDLSALFDVESQNRLLRAAEPKKCSSAHTRPGTRNRSRVCPAARSRYWCCAVTTGRRTQTDSSASSLVVSPYSFASWRVWRCPSATRRRAGSRGEGSSGSVLPSSQRLGSHRRARDHAVLPSTIGTPRLTPLQPCFFADGSSVACEHAVPHVAGKW